MGHTVETLPCNCCFNQALSFARVESAALRELKIDSQTIRALATAILFDL
jgi:hypothetical protein